MIVPILDVSITAVEEAHPVEPSIRARIADHWAAAVAANPALWNGTVLGTRAEGTPGGIAVAGGVLTAEAVRWDFASFIAWRDWGFPEMGLRNLFGSALVLTADGALVYGVMGPQTANAGKIYPPGGSLEPRDVGPDGRVDVIGSIERELMEETGLDHRAAAVEGTYVAFDGPRVSIGRVFRFPETAAELSARIAAFFERESDPELSGIAVLRRPSDAASDRFPPYAQMFAAHLLDG